LTGCRHSELASMKAANFNSDAGVVTFRQGKNQTSDVVPRPTSHPRLDARLASGSPWFEKVPNRILIAFQRKVTRHYRPGSRELAKRSAPGTFRFAKISVERRGPFTASLPLRAAVAALAIAVTPSETIAQRRRAQTEQGPPASARRAQGGVGRSRWQHAACDMGVRFRPAADHLGTRIVLIEIAISETQPRDRSAKAAIVDFFHAKARL